MVQPGAERRFPDERPFVLRGYEIPRMREVVLPADFALNLMKTTGVVPTGYFRFTAQRGLLVCFDRRQFDDVCMDKRQSGGWAEYHD